MTIGPGRQQFNTFLQRGDSGTTATTYLGATIPGCFCPNFGFRFKPHNDRWPRTVSNPIEHFTAELLILLEAGYYKPVTIKVHQSSRQLLGLPVDP
jgi:hypothetical protein